MYIAMLCRFYSDRSMAKMQLYVRNVLWRCIGRGVEKAALISTWSALSSVFLLFHLSIVIIWACTAPYGIVCVERS
jgi:hypothetical protein